MDTAVPLAVDLAGALSLVSLAIFLIACGRLIQDCLDAARHAATAARAELARRTTRTVSESFLRF